MIRIHSVDKAQTFLQYVWVIDQVWGQDGWILAEFFFCVFMDRDRVKVSKRATKERGQYQAILTEQACSINDFYMAFGKIFLQDKSGTCSPERARWLARSGSQSQCRI